MNNELHVIYGTDPINMVKTVLKKIEPEYELNRDMLVGIKPNLVVAKPASEGATTSPQVVEGIIQYLQERGIKNIVILESSWIGDNTKKAFQVCGYQEISQKYGVQLLDLKDSDYQEIKRNGLKIKVCNKVLELDYLINVPVLKAHCQTRFTCALKNLKGCIPDIEKRRFHTLGLHKPIAALAEILKSNLVIVDALQGDLTFEEGGNPVQMDRIITGQNQLLVDCYGASLLGYSYRDIGYLKLAADFQQGFTDISNAKIYEYNTELKEKSYFKPSGKALRLSKRINEKQACSACYGSLIHALQRLTSLTDLNSLGKLYIGQGYKGKIEKGTGIGSCTGNFEKSVSGCPPTAKKIVECLLEIRD